jgi:uncharacterized phage-associated protein
MKPYGVWNASGWSHAKARGGATQSGGSALEDSSFVPKLVLDKEEFMRHAEALSERKLGDMATTARDVANEFIRLAEADGKLLTPLQLIKLVYIAHGWMLGLYQRPLIVDRIEAWKYGPVIPDLYRAMRDYGGNYVTAPLGAAHRITFSSPAIRPAPLDDQERDLIRQVYERYGTKNGVQLSQLTHRSGTPWHTAWEEDSMGRTISNDLIAEHYRQLANGE